MTAQFNNLFRYHNVEYALAEISGGELFDPASFGLYPVMAGTACWRGYVAVFAISESHLILDALSVNLGETQAPLINGIRPASPTDRFKLFNNVYRDLNLRLNYTGSLLLGNEFIRELYVHMGFHPAWKYKTVIELTFEKGNLTAEFDCSERMAEIRHAMQESAPDGESGKKSIKK